MSLLHSFYCWGAAATILISSLFFFLFGMNSWKWLAVMWALIPAINIYNFATCPIEHLVNDGNGMGVRQLFRTPVVWLAICLMICSGASELAMAQWASAYAEAALGLSKTFGDLIGPCMFAITMGISRLIFGKYGEAEPYEEAWNLFDLLSFNHLIIESGNRVNRLYCMWFFGWNHVAWND